MKIRWWIGFMGLLWLALGMARWLGTAVAAPETLLLVDLTAWGRSATTLAAPQQAAGEVAVAAVQKTAVAVAAPGQEVVYTVNLVNRGQVTQTVVLSDTLPPQVTLTGLDAGLTYDADRRAVQWTGDIAPGRLAYRLDILDDGEGLPYLDLGEYGLPDLCDHFRADGGDCAGQQVTFNLGAAGYSVAVYGRTAYQVVVASDGVILLEAAATGAPHWLPDSQAPGVKLAGLWQDIDMTTGGAWRAAILRGYVAGQDVFYAQWQDAPHAANPDLTSRFAIALLLEQEVTSSGVTPSGVTPSGVTRRPSFPVSETALAAGSIFYLYDHISQPDALIAQGYAIGLQDEAGQGGFTYAYAGVDAPPRGTPPLTGTTLYWTPVCCAAGSGQRWQYRAQVTGGVGETAINTVHSAWSADAPAWSTHYLGIRHLAYLPVLRGGGNP